MVKVFVTQMCKIGSGCFIKKSELYQAYEKWCVDNNTKPVNKKVFGIYMIDIYKLSKNIFDSSGKFRVWYGIDLVNSPTKDYIVWGQV